MLNIRHSAKREEDEVRMGTYLGQRGLIVELSNPLDGLRFCVESTALVFVEQTPVRDDYQLDLAVSQLP